MAAYLGALDSRRKQLDYVNFYAYLHRLVDAKIGRLLAALGDPDDPESLRSRTVIVRVRRPRRDGALARRPAPEGVQRLRGDDQRAARRLQPGPVPGAGARPRRSARSSTCCRRSSTSPAIPRRARSGGPRTCAAAASRRSSPRRRRPERERVERSPVDLGAGPRAPGAGRERPGRDPLHLRRPPGRHRADRGARGSRTASGRSAPPPTSTRFYFDPDGRAAERVRDVRPAARSGRGPESRRCRPGASSIPATGRSIRARRALGEAMKEAGHRAGPATEVDPDERPEPSPSSWPLSRSALAALLALAATADARPGRSRQGQASPTSSSS